ncbi:MAG: HEAT repeat domain-containing protein [Kineosporiaceae bacterium]
MADANGRLVVYLTVVLTALVIVLVVLTTLARAWRRSRERRRHEADLIARPLILAALDGDLPESPVQVSSQVGRYLDSMAVGMAGKLRGADRSALADLLGRRGTVAAARRRTRSQLSGRRLRAVELLGSLGVAEAVPDLVARLGDPDEEVRRVAVRALGRTAAPEAVPALLALLDAPRQAESAHYITLALLRIGPAGTSRLADAVHTHGPRGREAAAQVLGWLGETSAVGALEQALQDDDARVRSAAVEALGRIGLPTAAPAMCLLLGPEQPEAVRITAATALGRLGDPGSSEPLRGLLAESHTLARAAATALSQLGPAGLTMLREESSVPESHEVLSALTEEVMA